MGQRHRDADSHSLTQGQGGNYHRDAPEPIMIPPAVSRKLDNQNKTASIRSRTSASRLTTVELDHLFAREGEEVSPRSQNLANGSVVVPAQHRPTSRSQQQQQQQQAQMSRARSQPDLNRGQMRAEENTYARHITRVDIGEPNAPSPSNRDRQFEYPDHRHSNGSAQRDNIYATPVIEPEPKPTFNYSRSGVHLPLPSSVIPPPPPMPAPEPPSPTSSEVVEISTNSPGYANVSAHIQMINKQFADYKEESPYESSFRPGKNARLSKTPADLSVNRSRHSSSYSGSGSGSGSDQSEPRQMYSPRKHVMAYEKHSASSESGSDKQSISFAEDRGYENAAKFVQEHPETSVIMTSYSSNNRDTTANAKSDKSRYYEPTPDYDQEETDTVKRRPSRDKRPESTGSAKVLTEVPPVRSLREQWQKRDGTSPGRNIAAAAAYSAAAEKQNVSVTEETSTPSHVTQRQSSITHKSPSQPQSKPPAPPSPTKEEEPSMSAFGNAIREAAIAREKRAKEQEDRDSQKQKEREKEAAEAERRAEESRQAAEKARQEEQKRLAEKEKQRQTPVAFVPPPPAVVAAAPLEIKKSQTPPANVQKQLEENRKREQSHNQLMAAIAKRRNYIDNATTGGSSTNDIDARIERNKSASPARPVKADQQNIELVKETTPPKSIAPIPTPAASATSSRRSSLKREAPQPPSPVKPQAPAIPSLDTLPREQASQPEETKAPESMEETDVDNFTARAERARQEWLKKRQAGTATLEKPKKREEPKKTIEDEDNNNVTKDEEEEKEDDKEVKPPKAPEFVRPTRMTPPRDPKPPSSAERAVSPSRGGLGDLASIIAQKALERQKTYEGDIDKDAGGPRGGHIVYGSQRSQNTNLSSGNSATDGQNNIFQRFNKSQSRTSLEITGATVDSSNTETLPQNQGGGSKSVLERTKMFESTPTKNGNSYSVKSVTRTTNSDRNGSNESSSTDLPFDLPPPLVVGHNKYSTSTSYDRITRKGPDSDVVSNKSSTNGNETVGWVINSSPPPHSHEFAMRRKLANRNGFGNYAPGADIAGDDVAQMAVVDQKVTSALADVVEVEVIPPPPLFDTDSDVLGNGLGVLPPSNFQQAFSHEDNASMVSSVSTLSTLSSNDHDNQFAQDSGYQSHIQIQFSSPSSGYHSTTLSQSEDLYSELAPDFEVAPPPPGFDDCSTEASTGYVDLQQENHYEELSTIQEFIPPPTGFDAVPRSDPPTSLRRNLMPRASLRKRYEEKDIAQWSVSDVADWLDSLNLSCHKHTFVRNRVTGQHLTEMGRTELIELGVTKVGDRMNIERAVKRALITKL